MKKYIFTESQVKTIIDHTINEGIMSEQRDKIYKLPDLAELVSRMGEELDYDTLLAIFVEVFRDEGDEGVIKLFRSATNLDLDDFGHGRYVIKY